jgi:hypothetical protein
MNEKTVTLTLTEAEALAVLELMAADYSEGLLPDGLDRLFKVIAEAFPELLRGYEHLPFDA